VDLQELVVRVAIGQMRFRLAPRFADLRGALIEELAQRYDLHEYGWSETQLRVGNEDLSRSLIVGSREGRFVYEQLERIDDYVENGRAFFGHVLDTLGVDEIQYLGVRTYWMAAVDSFDDLVAWMRQWLSPDEPFSGLAPTKLTDVGWVFEYHEKDPKLSVRLGPMKVEQVIEQFVGTDKRDLFPEQFLFLDLDRLYNEDAIPAGDAVARWEESLRKNLELGSKLGAALADRVKVAG
jgi:hypothetical protein